MGIFSNFVKLEKIVKLCVEAQKTLGGQNNSYRRNTSFKAFGYKAIVAKATQTLDQEAQLELRVFC